MVMYHTCSLRAFSTRRQSKRLCHDSTHDTVSNESSASSVSSMKKRRQQRARRTCAAQHKVQACLDSAENATEPGPRGREENAAEDSTPSSRGGLGTDITNRGIVRHVRKCGTGVVNGEASRSPKGRLGRCAAGSGHRKGKKSDRKPSCGRDLCGVLLGT